MISSTRFLALCHELKRAGWNPGIEPGMRVSRGYADLGYEEFLVLPNGKLLSLLGGSTSEFPEAHRGHFCVVPSVDVIVAEVRRRGFDISSVTFADQRIFQLRAEGAGRVAAAEAASIEEAFAKLFLSVMTNAGVKC